MIDLCGGPPMIILTSEARYDNDTYPEWLRAWTMIYDQLPDELRFYWGEDGFDGLRRPEVLKYFGMTDIRRKRGIVTFEFTEEQYTMFILRWL